MKTRQDKLRTFRKLYIAKKNDTLATTSKFVGAVIDCCGRKGKKAWVEDFVSVWNRYFFAADQAEFDEYLNRRLENPKLSAYAFCKHRIDQLSQARREKQKEEEEAKSKLKQASYIEFLENARRQHQLSINPTEGAFKKILDDTGYSYEYQRVFMLEEERGIIVDFFVESENIIFEVDGSTHDFIKDYYRDLQLFNKFKIVVVRYKSSQVACASPDEVLEVVKKTREWYKSHFATTAGPEVIKYLPKSRGGLLQTVSSFVGYHYDEKTDGLRLVCVSLNAALDTNEIKYDIVKKVREDIRAKRKKAA